MLTDVAPDTVLVVPETTVAVVAERVQLVQLAELMPVVGFDMEVEQEVDKLMPVVGVDMEEEQEVDELMPVVGFDMEEEQEAELETRLLLLHEVELVEQEVELVEHDVEGVATSVLQEVLVTTVVVCMVTTSRRDGGGAAIAREAKAAKPRTEDWKCISAVHCLES